MFYFNLIVFFNSVQSVRDYLGQSICIHIVLSITTTVSRGNSGYLIFVSILVLKKRDCNMSTYFSGHLIFRIIVQCMSVV